MKWRNIKETIQNDSRVAVHCSIHLSDWESDADKLNGWAKNYKQFIHDFSQSVTQATSKLNKLATNAIGGTRHIEILFLTTS